MFSRQEAPSKPVSKPRLVICPLPDLFALYQSDFGGLDKVRLLLGVTGEGPISDCSLLILVKKDQDTGEKTLTLSDTLALSEAMRCGFGVHPAKVKQMASDNLPAELAMEVGVSLGSCAGGIVVVTGDNQATSMLLELQTRVGARLQVFSCGESYKESVGHKDSAAPVSDPKLETEVFNLLPPGSDVPLSPSPREE